MIARERSGTVKGDILIAEDSPTQAEQLKYLLEKHDYRVIAAGNGREALDLLQVHKPEIVISDIIMPEMDGYEFCRQVKTNKELKNIPIILLTSLSNPEDVIKGLECGADNFITKPYDETYLISRISYLLTNMHLQNIDESQVGLTIHFGKRKYFISSNRLQIFNLLLSTYETAIQKNRELEKVQGELRHLNERLEEKVKQRTAKLTEEIEERKLATAALKQSEVKYRTLIERLQEGVYQSDIEGNIITLNDAGARIFGFHSYKEVIGKLKTVDLLFDLNEYPMIIKDLKKNGHCINEISVKKQDGTNFWILINTNTRVDEDKTIIGYEGVFTDITPRKQAKEKAEESYQILRRTMDGITEAIAATTEMRDPYTAGHQRRVTQLASAIGRELGLSDNQVEGIRVAGKLHDIGKMQVPTEILVKPGRLTDLEFGLIKNHAQAGYEILKNIDFPWPVAQSVLQHHERINGSGYPNGLSGDDIIIEAKILGVADVVEAMSSHRPYRPALGIEKAIEEINQNKNILYDKEVVNVCLKIFKKHAFKFE